MLIGTWKNFEDLEESLTLEELDELLKAIYNKENRGNQFVAAVNGIEMKSEAVDNFEVVKERAHRRLMEEAAEKEGIDADLFTLKALGFGVD